MGRKGMICMNETVRLYTRQNDKTLQELESTGRLLNRKVYVRLHFGTYWEFYMNAYDWFTETASKIIPKPEDAELPIWCSISKENCLKPIPGTVVYVLEVPKEKVIYFDESRWDYVLNDHYIPADDADAAAYAKHLDDIGVSDGFQFIHGKYKGFYPEEEQRIRESWQRVFEITDWSIFKVCGNLWEIRREWVKKVIRPGEEVE